MMLRNVLALSLLVSCTAVFAEPGECPKKPVFKKSEKKDSFFKRTGDRVAGKVSDTCASVRDACCNATHAVTGACKKTGRSFVSGCRNAASFAYNHKIVTVLSVVGGYVVGQKGYELYLQVREKVEEEVASARMLAAYMAAERARQEQQKNAARTA